MASVVGGPCSRANSTGTNNHARERRLEAGDWFVSPLHPLQDIGYRRGARPVAEGLCERVAGRLHAQPIPGGGHGIGDSDVLLWLQDKGASSRAGSYQRSRGRPLCYDRNRPASDCHPAGVGIGIALLHG